MEWGTNEILFYGGLILAGGSLLLTVIYFCIYKMKSMRLRIQLDAEYGQKDKK